MEVRDWRLEGDGETRRWRVEEMGEDWAFGEWAVPSGPMWRFVKSVNNWQAARAAVNAGWRASGGLW